jgi:hypothetical protein
MNYVKAFFAFWYDFLIGDDWGIALGIVILLPVAALLAHRVNDSLAAAVMLVGVLITGGVALLRAAR